MHCEYQSIGVIHGSLCTVIAIAYVLNKISSSVLNVGRQYTIDNQGALSVTRTLRILKNRCVQITQLLCPENNTSHVVLR